MRYSTLIDLRDRLQLRREILFWPRREERASPQGAVSGEQHRPGAKAPPPYGLNLWNPHAALLLSHRSGGHAPLSRLACDFHRLKDCSLTHGSISKPGSTRDGWSFPRSMK